MALAKRKNVWTLRVAPNGSTQHLKYFMHLSFCEENANGLALYFEPGPAMQCTCNHSHVVSHGVALSYTVSSVRVIQSAVAMQPTPSNEY